MHHFCTYFDRNYLVRGLALYQSLVRHANPFLLYTLCLDDHTFDTLSRLSLPNLYPIRLRDFEKGDDALLRAKANRSIVEYYFTCTPSLPLYILDHFQGVETVTYLDADLFFFSDPAPIYEEMGGQSILIVEHRFPAHLRHLEEWGIYNVGLLAFRNDSYGRACLQWWRERCLEWCYDRAENGRFADQKYLDDWPKRFPGVVVLRHKGAGLALWNAANYDIRSHNDSVLVDSEPLLFYHFHGLQKISGYLYDPGVDTYGIKLGTTLTQKVYRPYLHELQSAMRDSAVSDIRSLRRHSVLSGKDLVRLLTYKRILIMVGPWVSEIYLGTIAHSCSRLRRLAKHPLNREHVLESESR